jgi:hypothetical protein
MVKTLTLRAVRVVLANLGERAADEHALALFRAVTAE